jgi:hypothetical protein
MLMLMGVDYSDLIGVIPDSPVNGAFIHATLIQEQKGNDHQ